MELGEHNWNFDLELSKHKDAYTFIKSLDKLSFQTNNES